MTRAIPLPVLAAAQWVKDNWQEAHAAPSMAGMIRRRFGLTLDQSIKAIAEATRLREGR